MKLVNALPDLVSDMESALAHLGRGDLVKQLKEAVVVRWIYDDFADTVYLHLSATEVRYAERLSLYDEAAVNLDTDGEGRLCGIEILEGQRVVAELEPLQKAS